MRTSISPALLLSLALLSAAGPALAGTMVTARGYETPASVLTLAGGFEVAGVLTPAAAQSLAQRIEVVRDGLRIAAADAQCAPAAFERRVQRRLRRLVALLGAAVRSSSATDTRDRLTVAAGLHRSYCEVVRADQSLRADCALQLLLPCPKLVVEQ